MREMGVRDVLIYCRDHRCSYHVETNVDGWATTSGYRMSKRSSPARAAERGADVRPDSGELNQMGRLPDRLPWVKAAHARI